MSILCCFGEDDSSVLPPKTEVGPNHIIWMNVLIESMLYLSQRFWSSVGQRTFDDEIVLQYRYILYITFCLIINSSTLIIILGSSKIHPSIFVINTGLSTIHLIIWEITELKMYDNRIYRHDDCELIFLVKRVFITTLSFINPMT